jgi:8-amino-7-oxononanoate synthase
LDLAGNKEIVKAAVEAAKKYGVGGVSSRLVGGNFLICEELENALADFKQKESALVFPCGYQTNVGIISGLLQKTDDACIIMDKLNHASLWDGAKLSGVRIFVYEHNDMNSLEYVLCRAKNYFLKLVITESVFSMDGDKANLKSWTKLCKQYGAITMLDEAHSTGIFGKNGQGLANELEVENDIDISVGTLSKAFGVNGGFVCCSKKLKNYIVNKSRAFIYTTAVSPIIIAAALKSLEIIKTSGKRREKLKKLSFFLKQKLKRLGLNYENSDSQIIPIIIGDTEKTKKLSLKLFENKIFAPDIKPPTVPQNSSRIRISLTSGHTKNDILKLTNFI